ncbi:MAG: arylesterase [Rhodobacteraceae bacterium]|nr:arylesterase [Paracoccaceae bacterium]
MFQWVTYGVVQVTSKTALALCSLWVSVASAEQVTVLALGDSLTQGYGLPLEQGFVPQLEGALRAAGHDVTVINGGVSGDTTAGGLARVAWSLTPDVDAMIVNLGGNDLLRGIAPEVARRNIRGILEVAAEQDVDVLLVGMQAPGNYGPDYKAAFEAIFPDLAEEFETGFVDSYFAGTLDAAGGRLAEAARYFQPDGIHPSAEGVRLNVAAMVPKVEALLKRVGN